MIPILNVIDRSAYPEDLPLKNAADFRQAEAKVEILQSNPASQ
jgi:hypothetical protein